MKAKKILAGACASLMLAIAAIPAVSAADAVKVTIGKTEAKAGEKFSVTLDLADIPAAGINACDFGIKYDSAVITVTDVELGKLAKEENNDALEGVNALETNIESGLVSIIYGLGSTDSANYMKGSGVFLEISGTVSNNAKAGDKSDLDIVAIDRLAESTGTATNAEIIFGNLADDDSCTNYSQTITPGLVTVIGDGQDDTKPIDPTKPTEQPTTQDNKGETTPSYTGDSTKLLYGDVNLDNKVNTSDMAKLAKYILDKKAFAFGKNDEDTDEYIEGSAEQALEQADVKYDGYINSVDTNRLQNYVLSNGKITLGPE